MFNSNLETWDEVGHALGTVSVPLTLVNNLMMIGARNGVDINDLCSKGQLISKAWLASEFPAAMLSSSPNIHISAGWFGMVLPFISAKLKGDYSVVSVDVDPETETIANALNAEDFKKGRFRAKVGDIMDDTYDGVHMVINTSCEHIPDFKEWYRAIPHGTVVILQSNNNYDVTEHTNCSETLADFVSQCPMRAYHYTGTLSLPNYDRFMVIGRK